MGLFSMKWWSVILRTWYFLHEDAKCEVENLFQPTKSLIKVQSTFLAAQQNERVLYSQWDQSLLKIAFALILMNL